MILELSLAKVIYGFPLMSFIDLLQFQEDLNFHIIFTSNFLVWLF